MWWLCVDVVVFPEARLRCNLAAFGVLSKERKAMRTPEVPNQEPSQSVRLPRLVALISWPLLFLLVHVGLPWAISLLSTRYGWAHRRPGRGNLLALLLVGAGTAGVSWCVSLH